MPSSLSSRRNPIALVATSVAAVVLTGFLLFSPAVSAKPAGPAPLVLTAIDLPLKTLAAVPAGGTPSNLTYTISSSGGPFCLEGLYVDPAVGLGTAGTVYFYLERINGAGVSHPVQTLLDGSTQGSSPQDIVLSYGSQLCSSGSLGFHATQFAPPSGSGIPVGLFGTAIVLAGADVVVTAT
jgi:hypothetical protein